LSWPSCIRRLRSSAEPSLATASLCPRSLPENPRGYERSPWATHDETAASSHASGPRMLVYRCPEAMRKPNLSEGSLACCQCSGTHREAKQVLAYGLRWRARLLVRVRRLCQPGGRLSDGFSKLQSSARHRRSRSAFRFPKTSETSARPLIGTLRMPRPCVTRLSSPRYPLTDGALLPRSSNLEMLGGKRRTFASEHFSALIPSPVPRP
jgi:hypothetical protein